MKLYLLSQDVIRGYDTWDSCVVAAESEEDAKNTHPCPMSRMGSDFAYGWPETPEEVTVEYLGETNQSAGVICASFNAG